MRQIVFIVLFFSGILTCQRSYAQQNTPKTLLWRITGNGLEKPSYLYGTMHLRDRRLFFFGDSVYKSIENSAGFAMELDPNDLMDSLFNRANEKDTTSLLRKTLDKRHYDSVSKMIEKELGIPADKVTRKKVKEARDTWYTKIKKKDDMNTVVDMYLYNIANKQGKWVGGIEDVSDQLDMKDELGKDINIMDFIKTDEKSRRKFLEEMITIYLDGDIGKIDEWANAKDKYGKDNIIIQRNVKMARRMDSLAHIRNSFFAIGAAHLPGDSGVISLLRKRGYIVEPIFSSQKIAPEKYTYTETQSAWVRIAGPDSAYTVEMPGKPSELKTSEEITFKVYADLVTNVFFMTGFSFSAAEQQGDIRDRMLKSFLSQGHSKSSDKAIEKNGFPGLEVFTEKDNIYYRMQLFVVSGKFYMSIVGSEKSKDLNSQGADHFFESYTINDKVEAKATVWVDYKNEEKAFTLAFPKKPSIDNLREGEKEKNINATTYSSYDQKSGTYYIAVVNETEKGFVMAADSAVLDSKLNYYKQSKATITDLRKYQYEGNPAMSFTAHVTTKEADLISKIFTVNRGNRTYSLAVVTSKGKEDLPDVTNFFRSFKLLPYQKANWSKQSPPNNEFNIWAPTAVETDKLDTAGLVGYEIEAKLEEEKLRVLYLTFDINTTVTYNVIAYPVSHYYWVKDDSSFLANQSSSYYDDTSSYKAKNNPGYFDSLVYKKDILNGNVKGIEILVNCRAHSGYRKVRLFTHGDSAYHVLAFYPYALENDEDIKKVFTDFRFTNEKIPSTLFTNKTNIILDNLQNADSIKRSEALAGLMAAPFTRTDLPLLYKAYFKTYVEDTSSYRTINEAIGSQIMDINDSSTIDFVKENYKNVPAKLTILKMDMLQMLARQKTTASYSILKDIVVHDPPVNGTPYSVIYNLNDSMLLARQLFPEVASLYGDTLMGGGILSIALNLVDSNLLERSTFTSNSKAILSLAKKQVEQLEKNSDDYPSYYYVIVKVLGKINDAESIGLLNRLLAIKNIEIKQAAALALLNNGHPVATTEIKKIAGDISYRIDIYDELKKINKQDLFPKEYLAQQKFAESYLYNYYYDEEDGGVAPIFKSIDEKEITEDGIKHRYFLFKAIFSYDDQKEEHLAVCGPFDIDKKQVTIKEGTSKMKVLDAPFSSKEIDKQFKEFLTPSSTEEY